MAASSLTAIRSDSPFKVAGWPWSMEPFQSSSVTAKPRPLHSAASTPTRGRAWSASSTPCRAAPPAPAPSAAATEGRPPMPARIRHLITVGPCGQNGHRNKLDQRPLTPADFQLTDLGAAPRTPLHLGHLAAQTSNRRKLVRMGYLVQSPPPRLDQGPFRLRPDPVAARPHRAPQQAKSKLEARWL